MKSNFFFSVNLQDGYSPSMMHINSFHDHVMMILISIISVVLYVNMIIFVRPCFSRFFTGSESLETFWALMPFLILMLLATPSLSILYMTDELFKPLITVKVMGHQWYWSYEYDHFPYSNFDSYMIPTLDLKIGDFRLLEVDKSVKIPVMNESRFLVSSSDVIHSWTIPSMGVKIDAIPGRLNQLILLPIQIGVMYGQCSEICGSMHSFMPICLEILSEEEFFKFLSFLKI